MSQSWINFSQLRKQLDFGEVLRAYKVALVPKSGNQQYVAPCPLPGHKGGNSTSFSANLAEGIWQCFSCKQGGNVIDFAVLMAGKDKRNGAEVRTVAISLRDRFLPESKKSNQTARQTESAAARKSSKEAVINQPLDFALKTLEADHPYFTHRKLSAETVARFGLGYCKRGSLSGRIAVPLVDDAEQLVGYAGLILDEAKVSSASPRYIFPSSREVEGTPHIFDRGKFLYNGFRVERSAKDLIVVPECHLVWALWQAGFGNVVSLMSYECSDEQAALVPLLTANSARLWLVTPARKESRNCAESFLPKVASNRLCRWLRFEDEHGIAPNHPLLALLPRK